MEETKKKNSEARIRANNKYNKKNYSRTPVSLKHKEMYILNSHCQEFGYSKNGFIVQAIKEKIERDTGKSFEEFLQEKEIKNAQLNELSSSENDISKKEN